MVAFTRKHLFDALESGHKLCHYFRTETLARYKYAASGAIGDVLIKYHGFYGLESIYSKYRYPYDYLDPARYGVV
jgi:hypothetical protein